MAFPELPSRNKTEDNNKGSEAKSERDPNARVATSRPDHRKGMTRGQIREERRTKSRLRKTRRQRMYLFLASFLAIGLIIGFIAPSIFINNGSVEALGPLIDDSVDLDAGRGHIAVGGATGTYHTFPATSGSHYSVASVTLANGNLVSAPANWGSYDFFLPDQVLVHNLEHGGIGLHYDCPSGCPEIIDGLATVPPPHWTQFIMSPYPGVFADSGFPIVVTGWRHRLYLPDVSEDSLERLSEFVRSYQNRAPEARFDNQFVGHN